MTSSAVQGWIDQNVQSQACLLQIKNEKPDIFQLLRLELFALGGCVCTHFNVDSNLVHTLIQTNFTYWKLQVVYNTYFHNLKTLDFNLALKFAPIPVYLFQ